MLVTDCSVDPVATCVGDVEIAAVNHRLLLVQLGQVVSEIALPLICPVI